MPELPAAEQRERTRVRNLLAQEVSETRQRARLGGWFYAAAAALAFGVTGFASPYRLPALLVVGALTLLAVLRVALPVAAAPDEAEARGYLRRIWAVILATTATWGGFSAWSQAALPEPAPLITLLFSGAFGMAIAHTLCMRRLPAAVAIAAVMLPTLAVLWREVALGVGATWLVYMAYMLLVMRRSHREYWTRLELEEALRQQRDEFATQSRVDGLTGLPNRREFSESLEQAMTAAGAGRPLSLLILDIDHFKRINDTYGHLAGDACLLQFASRLREAFDAAGELCARLGGEEFGVVLPLERAEAERRAERFRKELLRVPLEFDGIRERVTTSIGCCGFELDRHTDADALYREADAALYRAKVAGRNRTECASVA